MGERPLSNAPTIELPNGYTAIPQHYLRFHQTLGSVRALLAEISMDDQTLLFAGHDQAGLYLQIGMIGHENYDRGTQVRPPKIVYGRKWRIDPDTPTSEVIQTAFLAIIKAYEHEVRELLTVSDSRQGRVSAPLSCHQDLPLLAANATLMQPPHQVRLASAEDIQACLNHVQFAQRALQVVSCQIGQPFSHVVIQLGAAHAIRQQEGELPAFHQAVLAVTLTELTEAELIFAVMDALLHINQRWVEEHFFYQGVARFSRQWHPRQISAVSVVTRPYARDAHLISFIHDFQQNNHHVDRLRVPMLGQGVLAERNKALIARYPQLLGHLPEH